MAPKDFTAHDLEIAQRLTSVETRLTEVHSDLVEHRSESQKRADELRDQITALSSTLDSKNFDWSKIVNQDNIKLIGFIILSLAGVASAAGLLAP